MYTLQERVHQFHEKKYKKNQALYEQLHFGQNPEILFITCADSRILPSELTQSKPGELFVIRNAGNLVPSYPDKGGESATIEYALTALNIKHIIVCGHSECGAMKGVLYPEMIQSMAVVNSWLNHAPKREDIINKMSLGTDNDLLDKMISENVLLQISHLKQYPCVQSKLEKNEIKLHAWIYIFETGSVFTYNTKAKHFEPLNNDNPAQIPMNANHVKQAINNNCVNTFYLDCLGGVALIAGGVLLLFGVVIQNQYFLKKGQDLIHYSTSNMSFFTPQNLSPENNLLVNNEMGLAHSIS